MRAAPILLVLPLLAGCLARPEILRLEAPAAVAVAYLQDDPETRQSHPVPGEVAARLNAALAARNLAVQPAGAESFEANVAAVRATRSRLAALSQLAGDAPYLALVETTPVFYSQMNGRYRWTVNVRLTMAPVSDLTLAVERSAELPAFLQYDHERETAALEAVSGQLAARLGALVDDFLAGRREAGPAAAE